MIGALATLAEMCVKREFASARLWSLTAVPRFSIALRLLLIEAHSVSFSGAAGGAMRFRSSVTTGRTSSGEAVP